MNANTIGPEILEEANEIKRKKNIIICEDDLKLIINICLKKVTESNVRFIAAQRIPYKNVIGKDKEKCKKAILKKVKNEIVNKIEPFIQVKEAQNDLRKEIDIEFSFCFIPVIK
jgi:hypothetical protein